MKKLLIFLLLPVQTFGFGLAEIPCTFDLKIDTTPPNDKIYIYWQKCLTPNSIVCNVLDPALSNTLTSASREDLWDYIRRQTIVPLTPEDQAHCNSLAQPLNTPPVAQNATLNMPENTIGNSNVLATDGDNDPLTFKLSSVPTSGSVSFNATGFYTYTPPVDFYGSDSFTFVANDGKADSNTAIVGITVNDVPPPPPAPVDPGFAVFVCTKLTVSGLFDCSWWSQIKLKFPINVTATDPILRCPKGWTGKSNMELCAPKWVTKTALINTDSVGVCFGKKEGDVPNSCNNPGGEGFEIKSKVFP